VLKTANGKQQTRNIFLNPFINPLRIFTAEKFFVPETTVNNYKKAFACSG